MVVFDAASICLPLLIQYFLAALYEVYTYLMAHPHERTSTKGHTEVGYHPEHENRDKICIASQKTIFILTLVHIGSSEMLICLILFIFILRSSFWSLSGSSECSPGNSNRTGISWLWIHR